MRTHPLALGDIFRMADQFHDSAALHFAHASGLLELTAVDTTAGRAAARLGWQPRKTTILLDRLTALGVLDKDEQDRYRNAPATGEFLVASSPSYMGGVIEHQRLQWDHWARLGEILATDGPLPFQQDKRLDQDEPANRAFHEAMRNLARANVPAFLALPEAQGDRHIIDLAGGHGIYLAALAAANPGITGEVWDRPGARGFALETFEAQGCADRCRFEVRDIADTSGYEADSCDVAMLNDCLHYFKPSVVSEILASADKMLRPGGTLLVATQQLDDDGIAPAGAAGFSLHMMVNTSHGGLHPTPWLRGELEALGLAVDVRPMDPLGRYVILRGVRPA